MSKDELSFDELRALWRDVSPAAEPSTNPAEEEAVRWMRDAWAEVDVPPLSIAVKRAVKQRRLAVDWSAVSLAAAALLIAGAALFAPLRERAESEATTASGAGSQQAQAPDEPSQSTDEQPGETVSPEITEEPSPIVACDSDRIEMRLGSVRLILLRQGEAAGGPTPGEPK